MFEVQGRTVREIALAMPATTRVFEEFKIDYCCHGDVQFDDACQHVGANPELVMEKIDGLLGTASRPEDESFVAMSFGELIDHILDKHHVYTRQEIQALAPLMAKVAARHGDHYQYLNELKSLFEAVCDDLEPHMMKEESVLFPYVRDLEYRSTNGMTASFPPFGTVQHPVKMMKVEHEAVGDLLAKMNSITNGYTLPEGACPSFTALYQRLQDLEKDLHQHIHLENNLLFPRAIKLEEKAFS